jgi:L-seryl-tRNA(Ser) seleniumtransferase
MRHLTRPVADIADQARRLESPINKSVPDFSVEAAELSSQIGSGALPLREIPSAGVRLKPLDTDRAQEQLERLASDLRGLPRPVIGRLQRDSLCMDFRCLDNEELFIEQLDALFHAHR